MRLIDADYLIDTIGAMIVYGTTPTDIWDMVNDAPTIDAVSVVRCRDCRWSEPNEFGDLDCRCHIPTFRVNADGFCSYGERMKGADDE